MEPKVKDRVDSGLSFCSDGAITDVSYVNSTPVRVLFSNKSSFPSAPGDGSGGESIYGGKFNDEKAGLKLKHDGPGVVGMANSGKNSNSCQFYITLKAAPQLDGKHVVFGRVIEGADLLDRIELEAASPEGRPRTPVTIADCGVL